MRTAPAINDLSREIFPACGRGDVIAPLGAYVRHIIHAVRPWSIPGNIPPNTSLNTDVETLLSYAPN